MFNPKTGRYDGISTAYRMKLVPALSWTPTSRWVFLSGTSDSRRRKAFDDTAAAMIKAAETLIPQEVPPGSGETAVGKGGVPLGRRGGRGGRILRVSPGNGTDKDK